ncbi:MAG TPA: CinA family protein [Jatrophihabitans sp.]|nr:CinA family protein [Jatrophihabitans sp.]
MTGSAEAAAENAPAPGRPVEPAAEDPADLAERAARLHALLVRRQQTVAVAESLTGGLVAAALTGTPGASATFRGGLVVYATDLKARLAGVPEDLLARAGAVDPQVALELARGVRARLSATWGVGVTGVAGPDPQDDRPVGTVFVAVAGPPASGETVSELQLTGDRNSIRRQSVAHTVALLLNVAERTSI